MKKELTEVLTDSFLDYAAYTIQRRAIPDVRDMLKFSTRQLLHALWHEGVVYGKPFKKGNKVAGLATFSYCHGDASAFGSYVRMAKPFSNNICLMEGQGNTGTLINPNDHAAARYLELREAEITSLLFSGLKKDTITEWEDTYDNLNKFPLVLPSIGYWNICNPCQGIATSCATSIPGFNLRDVNRALIKLIRNPSIGFDEIYCPPDFPTGATITNASEVKESIRKGTGSACRIRATITFNPKQNALIVSELPYGVFTNTICREINELISQDETYGIEEVSDFTGVKCNIELRLTKDAVPSVVIQKLYHDTSLESWFGINMIMLDQGRFPKVFGWHEACQAYIDHIRICKRRELEFDVGTLNARNHILDGLLIALASIEDVIATIKNSESASAAKTNLMKKYGLSEIQAQAILDLKLQRLAHMEAMKIEKELNENRAKLEELNNILATPALLDDILVQILEEVAKKFGDARRTKIANIIDADEEEEEEIPVIVRIKDGKISLCEKLLSGQNIKTTNKDILIGFAANGKMYKVAIKELTDKQIAISTLFKTRDIIAINSVSSLKEDGIITFITKDGYVKKTKMSEYSWPARANTVSFKLQQDDVIKAIDFNDAQEFTLKIGDKEQIINCKNYKILPSGKQAKGKKVIQENEQIDSVIWSV